LPSVQWKIIVPLATVFLPVGGTVKSPLPRIHPCQARGDLSIGGSPE
jgi:hypothetical protein